MINRRHFIAGSLAVSLSAKLRTNRVACQMNVFRDHQSPANFEEFLARAADLKRLGFPALECNVRFVESEFANAAASRERIKKIGMEFYCGHTESTLSIEELRRKADVARALGASRLCINGVVHNPARTQKPDDAELEKKVQTIEQLGAHCQKVGLILLYHNHGEEFVEGGYEMEELLRRVSPGTLSLMLDIGYRVPASDELPAFFTRHYRRIDGLHLHDMRGETPIYKAIAAAIEKTGWSGYTVLEEAATKADTDIEAVLSANRKIIRETFRA